MKLILAFKMKAMKGLFESFFFCFPLPTERGIPFYLLHTNCRLEILFFYFIRQTGKLSH